MYVVSGCLLGYNCKYNGGNNANDEVIKFCENHKYMIICPESAGKLPTPRPPAEKIGSRIIDKEGKDVTDEFLEGARICLKKCFDVCSRQDEKIEGAILKANSPSCGFGQIYDGTFRGKLVEGNGVFADMLSKYGIEIITEKERIKW